MFTANRILRCAHYRANKEEQLGNSTKLRPPHDKKPEMDTALALTEPTKAGAVVASATPCEASLDRSAAALAAATLLADSGPASLSHRPMAAVLAVAVQSSPYTNEI
jgi:hypothetical protein